MKKSLLLALTTVLIVAMYPTGSAFATKHVINVQNYSFSPSSITDVTVGDTMRWVWVSGSHTTTSTTIPATAATWDHPITSSNTFYEYKVTVAGTYNYKCTPHASMGMVGSFVATGAAPTLSVLPSNRNVGTIAGSTTFTVTSNSGWTAASNSAWCTVTASGNGNGSINAMYSENTSVSQRVANITVTVSGIPSQVVTVTQAGAAPTLLVGPSNQNVSYLAGTATVNVTSNTNWSSTCDRDWCSANASGSGNGDIIATYTENTTSVTRVATITITVAGLDPQSVTVTQDMSHVSVSETPGKNFSIYPSPSKGIVNVSLGDLNDKDAEISVYDAIGQNVLVRKSEGNEVVSLDLSSVLNGAYFIRVATSKGNRVGKIQIYK
jgi:plastocyanin